MKDEKDPKRDLHDTEDPNKKPAHPQPLDAPGSTEGPGRDDPNTDPGSTEGPGKEG